MCCLFLAVEEKKELATEYQRRVESVSSAVERWSEERGNVGSKMDDDEAIFKEMCATPCIAPRIIVRALSPVLKKEEKGKTLRPLSLMNTLPVKLQKTSDTQSSANSSRDSGRAKPEKTANKV